MKYIYLVIFKVIAEKNRQEDKNKTKIMKRGRRDTHSDKNAGNQRKKIADGKYAFKKGYNETIQREKKQINFVERIKTIMIRKVKNYSSIFFYP